MLSSKWIKILCYVLMGAIDTLAVIAIIYGFYLLIAESNKTGILFFVIGLLVPLIISVSVYPVFALANIDENFTEMNNKYDLIIEQMKISNCKSDSKLTTNNNIDYNVENKMKMAEDESTIQNTNIKDYSSEEQIKNSIDYVNKEYNIDIFEQDTLEVIKNKIEMINPDNYALAEILKTRIRDAKDINEIISILRMHMIINK